MVASSEYRSDTDWRDAARSFRINRIDPLAEFIDRTDELPSSILDGMIQERFLGLTISAEWGGVGAPVSALPGVLEELARGSSAVAILLAVHLSVCAAPISQWGTSEQKARCLPRLARGEWIGAFALTEPEVGSDSARLATRYTTNETGFLLRGCKMFITNGGLATVIVAFATRDPALGPAGISAFVVPKQTGVAVAQKLEKLGLHGSETTELVFTDAQLPPTALLGPEGSGLKVALGALMGGRLGIAACALGVAEAAFEELVNAAREHPGDAVRSEVARAFVDCLAARSLIERASTLRDTGQPYGNEASAAKLLASQVACRTAERAVDARGTAAISASARCNRLLRDARVYPIVEGTTEIQEMILGRSILERISR
ncbi:MAG: acyl-CoA dehydrogenase family protein [Thermoplasmata archaeon]|nr:acyl-CoA dehydrogenase family protein [Thermoplasmata archaeon]